MRRYADHRPCRRHDRRGLQRFRRGEQQASSDPRAHLHPEWRVVHVLRRMGCLGQLDYPFEILERQNVLSIGFTATHPGKRCLVDHLLVAAEERFAFQGSVRPETPQCRLCDPERPPLHAGDWIAAETV